LSVFFKSIKMFKNRKTFSASIIDAVWQKATIVAGKNPNEIRKDSCGAWIKKSEYGNTDSQFGWEVDHIKPIVKKGSSYLSNLQPLQWQNNRHKSDNYPNWSCIVSAA